MLALSPTLDILPNDIRAASVVLYDANGNLLSGFDPSKPATAAITELTFTAVTQVLFASNVNRRYAYIWNATNKSLLVALAATSALNAYSFVVPSNTGTQVPINGYTGDIAGILSGAPAASNKVYVTEVTP